MGIDTRTVAYHFVDLDRGVEIFFEKRESKGIKGCVAFAIYILVLGLRKSPCKVRLFLYFFFVEKKRIVLKVLDQYFHPLLLNSFYLPTCGSESMKKCILRLLLKITSAKKR